MKKIIAAFDGLKYSDSTEKYAIAIASQMKAHLVGVFLDDFTYSSYKIYDLVVKKAASEKTIREYSKKDRQARDLAVAKFEQSCRKAGIEFNIHRDKNIAIQDLLHETIFADLLIIDSKETLTHYNEKLPTRFVSDILAGAQCPVLVVPQKYLPVKKVIFLYDGDPSAVHAIKMFSYTLPLQQDISTEVVAAKGFYGDLHVPDNRLMKEFMKRHFPSSVFSVLKGDPKTEIVNHLKTEKQDSVVVLGAYRRGAVSRWLKESLADTLLKEIKLPLFVAHNKQ